MAFKVRICHCCECHKLNSLHLHYLNHLMNSWVEVLFQHLLLQAVINDSVFFTSKHKACIPNCFQFCITHKKMVHLVGSKQNVWMSKKNLDHLQHSVWCSCPAACIGDQNSGLFSLMELERTAVSQPWMGRMGVWCLTLSTTKIHNMHSEAETHTKKTPQTHTEQGRQQSSAKWWGPKRQWLWPWLPLCVPDSSWASIRGLRNRRWPLLRAKGQKPHTHTHALVAWAHKHANYQ